MTRLIGSVHLSAGGSILVSAVVIEEYNKRCAPLSGLGPEKVRRISELTEQ
jgi:hypothetical protein